MIDNVKSKRELSETAYQLLKQKLNNRTDSYISARALAAEMGMSYIPVRDALNRLQNEGLIKKIPNVGYFVVRLGIEEVIQIFQVRECIEVFTFSAIFDSIENRHIADVEKIIENQEEALKANNMHQYVKEDERFHQIFIDIYSNEYFSDFIKGIREQYLICSNKIAKSNSFEGIEEHKQILKYIKDKNREKAVDMMKQHIQMAKQRMKDGFTDEL